MKEYQAPKLTKYGKVRDFIQAGSVMLQTGDLTGDGVADTAFDTNGDGRADVIVGGVSGTQTPVTFVSNETSLGNVQADFYDSDGDGLADFAIAGLNIPPATLQRINSFDYLYLRLSDTGTFETFYAVQNTETSNDGGWDDPARD